jgi:hypothetical protein
MLNWTVSTIKPKLEAFKIWLVARGAELHDSNGEYELLRFKTDKGVSIFYFKKNGAITFYGEARNAWLAFKNQTNWRAVPPTARIRKPSDQNTVRTRDGHLCFFCSKTVEYTDGSLEHLVALTHGGPNHISNKFLAHVECNNAVGHLSAPEKIRIHTNGKMLLLTARLKANYGK